MEIQKSDVLKEGDSNIIETIEPYYTDPYSAGETKEQYIIGKEVKNTLSKVAHTGDYNDLANKPPISNNNKYCKAFINSYAVPASSTQYVSVSLYQTNDDAMKGTPYVLGGDGFINITRNGFYLINVEANWGDGFDGAIGVMDLTINTNTVIRDWVKPTDEISLPGTGWDSNPTRLTRTGFLTVGQKIRIFVRNDSPYSRPFGDAVVYQSFFSVIEIMPT